jgi:GNAT superfamily N-acetyltransferase
MSDASAKRSLVQDPAFMSASVRRATLADAPAVAALVNQAYAIEAFFVDGDRTDAAEIARMMGTGSFIVLDHGGGLAGAVYVERHGYFGMLAVAPEQQGHGLGKRLVRIAEALCEAGGCDVMSLRIINLREELGRWYRSLGYREVGVTPYTHRPVKRPCHFIEMQRVLRAPATLAA